MAWLHNPPGKNQDLRRSIPLKEIMSNKLEATFHPYGRRTMTKAEILAKIEAMEAKIAADQSDLKNMRSPGADAMRATLPMMKDCVAILRAVVEFM